MVTIGAQCEIAASAILGRIAPRGWTARDPGPAQRVTIGSGCLIGALAVIYAGCTVGDGCLIGDGASLYTGVTLGRGVRLGRLVTISYAAQLGDGTVVMDGSHITGGMRIGRRCFVGPNVTTANDATPRLSYDADRLAPPVMGDDVLIGAGAVLAPGITVGHGATIGAGAVVLRDVPPGATVMAAPGRIIPR